MNRNSIHTATVVLQLVAICSIAIFVLMELNKWAVIAMLAILFLSIMQQEVSAARDSVKEETKSREAEPQPRQSKKALPAAESEAEAPAGKEEKLRQMFEEFLINNQNFLQPGLTIVNVAEELGTNKTYLSKIVNSSYGMTFPELMNSLRIDYAEQYILHNTDAKQADVAMACGFANASAFNNTFKKLVGVTPKAWLDEKTSK